MAAVTQARWRPNAAEMLSAALLTVFLFRGPISEVLDRPGIRTWSTVFVAICVQAIPFLALGVVLSGAITAFVSPAALARVLPANQVLAVPVAGAVGMALPGCECGSVPIAGRLVGRGVPGAAALTFLLAAPAVNPVVLVATAVAFPGEPEMVLARYLASMATAVLVGWAWLRLGRDDLLDRARRPHPSTGGRLRVFQDTAVHDLLHAGGFLVVGALAAATLQVAVPRSILDAVADAGPFAVLALGGLAVLLAVCSEADAFVAASLRQFSRTAQLAFMVIGPAVDIKLVALQTGVFGRRFAIRFAPLTLGVALTATFLVGWLVL